MKLCIPALATGLLLIVSLSDADVFLHNLRGSNNRLNENSPNRANNNRMFDSQVSVLISVVLSKHKPVSLYPATEMFS